MSNIDKQALRDSAESTINILENIAGFEPSDIDGDTVELRFETEDGFDTGCDVSIVDQRQKAADVVQALLDELEAKDNRINRLEAIVAVAEQRNALMREWKRALKVPCDLVDDQVPVVIHGMVIRLERLKETEDKLTAAEKRIAELEVRDKPKFVQCWSCKHDIEALAIADCDGYCPRCAAPIDLDDEPYAAAGKGE
ncbi:ead/Ea22-like family protein [Enterobacter hormaechei]|nr:ead/Ea22-like family protein [Enterobacter hormaechei]ELC7296104.1 ead/Ea22-like family protein [Enterobacter hormaechei]